MENVRVAICGALDTARAVLKAEGVGCIDNYSDALDLAYNIRRGAEYHLILVYAPQGEGLMDMVYPCSPGESGSTVPVRLLNEPCCKSALIELKSIVRRISAEMEAEAV